MTVWFWTLFYLGFVLLRQDLWWNFRRCSRRREWTGLTTYWPSNSISEPLLFFCSWRAVLKQPMILLRSISRGQWWIFWVDVRSFSYLLLQKYQHSVVEFMRGLINFRCMLLEICSRSAAKFCSMNLQHLFLLLLWTTKNNWQNFMIFCGFIWSVWSKLRLSDVQLHLL